MIQFMNIMRHFQSSRRGSKTPKQLKKLFDNVKSIKDTGINHSFTITIP